MPRLGDARFMSLSAWCVYWSAVAEREEKAEKHESPLCEPGFGSGAPAEASKTEDT